MVRGFPSDALVGIGGGSGSGGVDRELQELHAQSIIRRYSAAFRTEHFE